ncbi:hypothetical protein RPAGB_1328 [Rickettsia parkeri str. Grand Bay]|nr:hypothetical protein RPAGB_1328 [Rickettsia parkeri str. Grand Bay]
MLARNITKINIKGNDNYFTMSILDFSSFSGLNKE